jgi:hypothetical protein
MIKDFVQGKSIKNMFLLIQLYIHTYHSRLIPEGVAEAPRYNSETPTFYQNYFGMRNTADVKDGKPMAI